MHSGGTANLALTFIEGSKGFCRNERSRWREQGGAVDKALVQACREWVNSSRSVRLICVGRA